MDYLSKLHELVRFQRFSEPSLEEVFALLAQRTFSALYVDSLFLAVLRANGAIHFPARYSKTNTLFVNYPERVLDTDTPGRQAFVRDQVVECGSFEEYPFYYPQNVTSLFPNGFQSSLAIPVPGFGALTLYSSVVIVLEHDIERFLQTVGEILALHLEARSYRAKFNQVDFVAEPSALLPLTPRQWAIHEAILKGLPNGAIAKELSYSESLIRQETMRIYSKLGIRGRKDLPIRRRIES